MAQHFSYVTMFSGLWALGPLMGLLRNIFHSQANAFVMFT